MKFPVYDYRTLEGGRPKMVLYDVPPDLEYMVDTWKRNDWVIGIVDDGTDHHVCVAAVDFLSDVVLHKIRIDHTEASEIFKIMAIDSVVITTAQRAQIQEGTTPKFDDGEPEEA